MKPTNFDCRIDKHTALFLLEHKVFNDDENGVIMCKEYGDTKDWVGVTSDDIDTIMEPEYKTFEIWLR